MGRRSYGRITRLTTTPNADSTLSPTPWSHARRPHKGIERSAKMMMLSTTTVPRSSEGGREQRVIQSSTGFVGCVVCIRVPLSVHTCHRPSMYVAQGCLATTATAVLTTKESKHPRQQQRRAISSKTTVVVSRGDPAAEYGRRRVSTRMYELRSESCYYIC